MISSFAHILSHYMAKTTEELPPSGAEYWPHATELLAIFTVLKEIPVSNVSKHLKKHLRSFFKKAIKEISEKNEENQSGIDHD